jgi:flagellar M-ring protein FliF
VNGLTNFVRTLGLARIAALAGICAALIGFFAFVFLRVSEPPMAPLFGPLAVEDAGAIVSRLEAMGVRYELKGDGGMILVPEDRVLRLRMAMAEEGLPSSRGAGYELFDKQDAFGATSFMQNLNRLRALEGELARTISAIETVASARVHLVTPKRELFASDATEPSASIVIHAKGAGLTRAQVKAIQNLVAAAVEGLKPQRVAIVDTQGELLSSGDSGDPQADMAGTYDERTAAYEARIRTEVEDIVTHVVGPGKARVQIAADIDFNRVTQNFESYDPDGQVVRSTQTVEENSSNNQGQSNEATSVAQNLPDQQQPQNNTPTSTSAEASNRTEETVNYEISKTTKTEITEAGRVKRLSVAVLVDGNYMKDANGGETYKPRSQEELDKIASLVRSAIGFDEKRGDQVSVVNLRFAEPKIPELTEEKEPLFGLGKSDYMRIGETVGLLLVALLTMLFVIRPTLNRLLNPAQPALGDAPGPVPQIANQQVPQLASPVAPSFTQAPPALAHGSAPLALPVSQSNAGSMIDIAQVEGQVKESSVRKVGEIVGKHPDEAMAIVRTWLYQGN